MAHAIERRFILRSSTRTWSGAILETGGDPTIDVERMSVDEDEALPDRNTAAPT